MNAVIKQQSLDDVARFVEVLTSDETGETIGYCLGGERPGPHVLVVGYASEIDPVFDRLSHLPTLPWMWGKLFVVTLDTLDHQAIQNARSLLSTTQIDETLMLPHRSLESAKGSSIDNDYWAVLNTCARLGMIAGRGVPRLD